MATPGPFREKSTSSIRANSKTSSDNYDQATPDVAEKYRGTKNDKHDMNVLGKKQELRRNFNFITMLGFTSTCLASWEGLLVYLGFALTNGGTGLLFWGFIACAIGQALVYLSIAEMASMSPAAGGQYQWVSEFAPPKWQKLLSYLSGWLTAIGWQFYAASVCFLIGTIVQGLIVLNQPETYVFERWHGTLMAIAVVFISILFNTVLASRLPVLEGVIMVVHVLGLFAIVGAIWATALIGKASVVLFDFTNSGGWPTTGLSAMVGLLATAAPLVGYDCSVHMSEEIKDASLVLPRAIIGAVIMNFTLVFLVIITVCFTIADISTASATPTGYPFIQLFFNSTQSYAATNAMTAIILLMLSACAVTEIAAASRQLWSFARDAGVPGHSWLSKVTPGWNIPIPAVVVSLTISALCSLINLGSTVALNAITSLGAVAVLISYFLTISCVVYRRIAGPELPPRRWSLGRWGLAVNCAALVLLAPLIFFFTWPVVTPVTAETMNWSSVMLCGTLIVAMVYYVFKGRFEYVGPVKLVKREA
ncbi:amino acid permease-1 [Elsinoe australis]|uniref:Amino acid permease-1 n=1 Tax=Elsinoe australis TaxID=40998 RepID=A0A4U7B8G6_9PEZI|nr:amino acid permease-1 [Elsinoe australis]